MAGAPDPDASAERPIPPIYVRDPEIVNALADSVAILGADFRPLFVIGGIGGRVGFSRYNDLSMRLADWVHPSDHGVLGAALQQALAEPGIDIETPARVHN